VCLCEQLAQLSKQWWHGQCNVTASSLDCKSVTLTTNQCIMCQKYMLANMQRHPCRMQMISCQPLLLLLMSPSSRPCNISRGFCGTGLIATLLSFNHVPSFFWIIKAGYFLQAECSSRHQINVIRTPKDSDNA